MKLFIVLLAVAVAQSKVLEVPDNHSAYGYLEKSIAIGEKRMEFEASLEDGSRIVGGVAASLGQYPFQAGLLIDIIGHQGRGVCGASLLSRRVLSTAAHCWFDGIHQGWRMEVVLGTVMLFQGGNRQFTSVVVNHPNWFPLLVRNDVAVVYLNDEVTFSANIAPVSLPTGAELQDDFNGQAAVASGFGLTSDDQTSIPLDQVLQHVNLRIITNSACRLGFPLVLHDTNICTSGIGNVGTCQGDSGGPLTIARGNERVLVGITSFGSALGCQIFFPAAYARVTSFMDFFNQHL